MPRIPSAATDASAFQPGSVIRQLGQRRAAAAGAGRRSSTARREHRAARPSARGWPTDVGAARRRARTGSRRSVPATAHQPPRGCDAGEDATPASPTRSPTSRSAGRRARSARTGSRAARRRSARSRSPTAATPESTCFSPQAISVNGIAALSAPSTSPARQAPRSSRTAAAPPRWHSDEAEQRAATASSEPELDHQRRGLEVAHGDLDEQVRGAPDGREQRARLAGSGGSRAARLAARRRRATLHGAGAERDAAEDQREARRGRSAVTGSSRIRRAVDERHRRHEVGDEDRARGAGARDQPEVEEVADAGAERRRARTRSRSPSSPASWSAAGRAPSGSETSAAASVVPSATTSGGRPAQAPAGVERGAARSRAPRRRRRARRDGTVPPLGCAPTSSATPAKPTQDARRAAAPVTRSLAEEDEREQRGEERRGGLQDRGQPGVDLRARPRDQEPERERRVERARRRRAAPSTARGPRRAPRARRS